KFTVDILVDNEGEVFSGGEFGLKLEGAKLLSVEYVEKNISSAGPIERDNITYIGFFNKENTFSDGKIAKLTFSYDVNSQGSVEVVESQITTRIDKFTIDSNKKINPLKINIVRSGHEGEIPDENNKEDKNEIQFAPTEKIPKQEILNAINSGDKDVVINLLKPTIIESEIFKALKGKSSNLIINLLDDDKAVVISWIFNGKDIMYDNIDFNADVNTSIDEEIKSKTLKSPLQCFNLPHVGYLPGKCKVNYKLSDVFSSEDKVNVFYNDGNIKEVIRDIDLLNSKEISFYINTGGKYFITTSQMKNADKNYDAEENSVNSSNYNNKNNIWIYTTILFASTTVFLLILLLMQNKKMKKLKSKS
ncbi:MAG: hypothetical protein ACRDA5_14565, partial [Clostridium sp.]